MFFNKLLLFTIFLVGVHSSPHGRHEHKHRTVKDISSSYADSNTRWGYDSAIYYVNWAIYARNFTAQELLVDKFTHINYAFADVRPSTGEVILTDEWADIQKTWPGDVAENGTNIYGNLKQLYLLKKQNRNLKTLLSIGGWTLSANISQPASTDKGRKNMAKTAVELMADTGFDGLDIDWEYPANETEGQNMVLLLKEFRTALDEHAQKVYGNRSKASSIPHFLLSIAAPAGPLHYKKLPLRDIADQLDLIQLMAYDYAGGWDNTTGHNSNIFFSKKNPISTPLTSTESAINDYIFAGVPPQKLLLGMPLYGRAFEHTKGMGLPYNGTGPGSWEAGVYDYKALPLAGCTDRFDTEVLASYCYNNSTGTLVSYDTPKMAAVKAEYIKARGLAGAMWWESSGDKKGDESLVTTVTNGFKVLRQSENVLEYPTSKYSNLRAGMPGQ